MSFHDAAMLATLSPLVEQLENALADNPDFIARKAEVGSPDRLSRFLLCRDGDVAKAKEVVEAHLQWRKENNVEHWREVMHGKPFLTKHFPHAAHLHSKGFGMTHACMLAGKTRNGEALMIEILGAEGQSTDISSGEQHQDLVNKLTEYYLSFFEQRSVMLEEWSKEQARLVRTVQIRDVSNLSFMPSTGAFSVLQKIMSIGMNNYPESASTVFFVSPPSVFSAIFAIVKRWLPQEVDRKFRFVAKQDIPLQLMRVVRPCQLVALQDLHANKNGDNICERLNDPAASTTYSAPTEEQLEICVSARDVHIRYYELNLKGVRKVAWKRLNTEESPKSLVTAKIYYVKPQVKASTEAEVVCLSVSPEQTFAELPLDVDEALLCLTLDHTSAWLQSHTFKLVVETSG